MPAEAPPGDVTTGSSVRPRGPGAAPALGSGCGCHRDKPAWLCFPGLGVPGLQAKMSRSPAHPSSPLASICTRLRHVPPSRLPTHPIPGCPWSSRAAPHAQAPLWAEQESSADGSGQVDGQVPGQGLLLPGSGPDAGQHCSLPWSLSYLPAGVNGRGSSECPAATCSGAVAPGRAASGQQLQRSLWQGSERRQRQERAASLPWQHGQTKAGSGSACDPGALPVHGLRPSAL